jgi:Zn-dependent alcohol dehydrogenase
MIGFGAVVNTAKPPPVLIAIVSGAGEVGPNRYPICAMPAPLLIVAVDRLTANWNLAKPSAPPTRVNAANG